MDNLHSFTRNKSRLETGAGGAEGLGWKELIDR